MSNYTMKNFKIQELVTPTTFDVLGESALRLFDPHVLTMLDKFRDNFGQSLVVNNWHIGGDYKESGLRDIITKTGAKRSAHKFGIAFDLKTKDMDALREFIKSFGAFYCISRVEHFDKTPTWCHVEFGKVQQKSIYFFNP